MKNPPGLQPKYTTNGVSQMFMHLKKAMRAHPVLSVIFCVLAAVLVANYFRRRRILSRKSHAPSASAGKGFFVLDTNEKGLGVGGGEGKVD
jgi:hypothetical protein